MKQSSIQNLIILFLITLFIGGSGFVVLYGAQFYTTMVKENELSLARHSLLLYFNNRIKQHDGQGLMTVITQNNVTALEFIQDNYYTLVYEYEGYLVEQSSETAHIDPLEAQKILPLSKLNFTFEDHGISIHYTDQSGENIRLRFTLIGLESSS